VPAPTLLDVEVDPLGEFQIRMPADQRDTFGRMKVEVLDARTGSRLGTYERRYGHLFHSFHVFRQAGRPFALYSDHYTCTRVMSLPDCKDLGGEKPESGGFCPVDYFVPQEPGRGLDGQLGFVAGCVWADDNTWKVELLDLRRATEGLLRRIPAFGYEEYERDPDELRLREMVDLSGYTPQNPLVTLECIFPHPDFDAEYQDRQDPWAQRVAVSASSRTGYRRLTFDVGPARIEESAAKFAEWQRKFEVGRAEGEG
jgi:hypothetical protein